MRAKELVPILAESFGVPFETAFMIDRSLAENGFRARGKGRAWPQMTRREAIYFLIGCMTATTTRSAAATRAADDVAIWASAESELSIIYNRMAPDELAGLEYDAKTRRRLLKEKVDRSKALPFLKGMHGRTVTLVDYLLMATSHGLGEGDTFTLSPSHFEATIKIDLGFGEFDEETFWVPGRPIPDPYGKIRTDISVFGTFFSAIAARTEDPFAAGRVE
jgi:hypothetical protein